MCAETLAPRVESLPERTRSPGTVVARFIARSVSKTSIIVGYAFAFYVTSSIYGYSKTYASEASRQALAVTFGNNPGFNAILGVAHNIDTVRGFAAWRTLAILTIVGAIWALVVATKRFRGEEESGHSEIMLAGQTTQRQAAANTLIGLSAGVIIIYIFAAATAFFVGQTNNLHFTLSESLFYALALVAGIAMFFAIGALASQIAATRRRAAAIATGVFGISYLLRAIGDAATGAHWLTDISPLGWIENLRPLTGSNLIWLLPIGGLIATLCSLTIYFSGRRDLGASLLPDKDTARARTKFLNGNLGFAFRDAKGAILGWLSAIIVAGLAMGMIAKAAGEGMLASDALRNYVGNLTQTSPSTVGATIYLGLVFFMFMAAVMALAASFIGSMREDEAEGYLDNLFVRPVSRLRWLRDRLAVLITTVIAAGLAAGIFTWLAAASQHSGIAFRKMLEAGVNTMIPAAVIIGIGVLLLGIRPRFVSLLLYTIIGWSFLLEMIGPVIKLNHWILDTSLLHHVAAAPTATPRWGTAAILIGIGAVACIIGAIAFNRRDLVSK
jgi:ABC-2 type transport system permease protein